MEEKIIEQNEVGKTVIGFDGEMVVITQISRGGKEDVIHLYLEEFEEGVDFVKNLKTPSTLIFVNGKHMVFDKEEISYEDVLKLLGLEDGVYSVTYTRGIERQKGSLDKGQYIKVNQGIRFNCDRTDNA